MVNSDFDVSSLKMKVLDSSTSKCSFTSNDSKTIEIGDDQILTINGISSGNNKIGEITFMSSINDEPKKNKTITISDIVATKSDGTEVRGIDVSKNVYVQSVDNSLKNFLNLIDLKMNTILRLLNLLIVLRLRQPLMILMLKLLVQVLRR